jgi:hypothetical protein
MIYLFRTIYFILKSLFLFFFVVLPCFGHYLLFFNIKRTAKWYGPIPIYKYGEKTPRYGDGRTPIEGKTVKDWLLDFKGIYSLDDGTSCHDY